MGNIIQSIPEAKLLLASLRSVGYTEETAIADIVDNCISAKRRPKRSFTKQRKKLKSISPLFFIGSLRKMALLFASMEQRFNHGTRSLSIIMPLKSLQMKLYGQTMVHLKL